MPAPDGVSVDHRHVGDPIDDALARLADPLVTELTAGHPERIKIVRQRHLRLDLLRHVTDEPSPLVRHGDLRQSGEGRPPSRARAAPPSEVADAAAGSPRLTVYSAAGTWASTDWIAWAAPSRPTIRPG